MRSRSETRLLPIELDALRRFKAQGMSYPQIADKLRRDVKAVRNAARLLGLPVESMNVPRATPDQLDRLRSAFDAGASVRVAAKAAGMDPTTARRWRIRMESAR